MLAAAVLAAIGATFFDSEDYKTRMATVENGIFDLVAPPGCLPLPVVHVFGSPRERGRAHGQLLSERILHFANVALPAYYVQQVDDLVTEDKLPAWLQSEIRRLADQNAAAAVELALGWLEGIQHGFNNASAAAVYEEMDAIAEGACEAAVEDCDAAILSSTLRRMNVLPDLIRMQCSMLGA